MVIQAKNFSVLQPDYFENRNENYLLIWKNIPHWMVIDKEAYQFITLANGSRSLNEILTEIYTNENLIALNRDNVKLFIENLEKNGLLNQPHNKLENSSTKNIIKLENITINLTRKCNLRCKHCFISNYNSNDTLCIDDFKKFVIEAKSNHYLAKHLNFAILGGEPLLEKQKLIEIAKFGQELGYSVIVSTNGLLIDSEFAKQAKENGLEVQVSLEGASKKTNDKIRGKGTFEKVEKALKKLVDHQVHTIISMVVHNGNFNDIESVYYLSKEIGVNEVRFIPLKIMGQAKNDIKPIRRKQLLFGIHNLIRNEPSAKKYLGRDFYSIMTKTCANCTKTAYCGTGLKTVLIDSDGEVYPCPNHNWPEFRCGNIQNKSFEEIWLNSPILQNLRTTYNVNTINDDCANCVVKYWCAGGCRGEAYENSEILTSKAVSCDDIRDCIIETFWILSKEDYSNYPKQREYF